MPTYEVGTQTRSAIASDRPKAHLFWMVFANTKPFDRSRPQVPAESGCRRPTSHVGIALDQLVSITASRSGSQSCDRRVTMCAGGDEARRGPALCRVASRRVLYRGCCKSTVARPAASRTCCQSRPLSSAAAVAAATERVPRPPKRPHHRADRCQSGSPAFRAGKGVCGVWRVAYGVWYMVGRGRAWPWVRVSGSTSISCTWGNMPYVWSRRGFPSRRAAPRGRPRRCMRYLEEQAAFPVA